MTRRTRPVVIAVASVPSPRPDVAPCRRYGARVARSRPPGRSLGRSSAMPSLSKDVSMVGWPLPCFPSLLLLRWMVPFRKGGGFGFDPGIEPVFRWGKGRVRDPSPPNHSPVRFSDRPRSTGEREATVRT